MDPEAKGDPVTLGELERRVNEGLTMDPQITARVKALAEVLTQRNILDARSVAFKSLPFATVPELLSRQSAKFGNQCFLEAWSQGEGVTLSLSYAEFERRVASAAATLAAEGVEAGDRVALLSHPTVQFHVYSMATICLGAVSVNLNWRHSKEGLLAMIQLSGSNVLISSASFEVESQTIMTKASLKRVLWLEKPKSLGAVESGQLLAPVDGPVNDATRGGASEFLPRSRPVLGPSSLAVIMFTSGSTAVPKGVPLTHGNLMWLCHQLLLRQRELGAFKDGAAGGQTKLDGTLSFLPNFHVIGYCNNFIFNLFAGVRCAVDRDAGKIPLSASRLLDACNCLKPTILETVPHLVEGMLDLLDKGEASAMGLQGLNHLQAGGAALNDALLSPLRKHSITLYPHYGQTELTGTIMIGGLQGDLRAMRLLPGVQFELVGPTGEREDEEGELVLQGAHCATDGYLPGSGGRILSGDSVISTAERFFTGDIFKLVHDKSGENWLRHVCRRDDLIVHNTGEMTNPLPIESALIERCHEHVAALCVFGQGQPSCFLALELREVEDPVQSRAAILSELLKVNSTAPSYSRIAARHVFWLFPFGVCEQCLQAALPRTVKGNVVRSEVEATFASQLQEVRDSSTEEVTQLALPNGAADTPIAPIVALISECIGFAVEPDTILLETGIDSSSAVEIRARLQEAFSDRELPGTLLFDFQTVRELAEFLGGHTVPLAQDAKRSSEGFFMSWPDPLANTVGKPIIKLQTGKGNATPLVIAPGYIGDSGGYEGLCKHLEDRTVFALEHKGLRSGEPASFASGSFASFAEQYAQSILDELGNDAFDIVGASLGAILAHQIAAVAQRIGGSPRRLVLIDPPPAASSPCTFRKGFSPHSVAELYLQVTLDGVKSVMSNLDLEPLDGTLARMKLLPEDALAAFLTTTLATIGLIPGTPSNVVLISRKLQVVQQTFEAVSNLYKQGEAWQTYGGNGANVVMLVLSTQRQVFWDEWFDSLDSSSLGYYDVYGSVGDPLVVEGTHADVCSKCVGNRDTAFSVQVAQHLA